MPLVSETCVKIFCRRTSRLTHGDMAHTACSFSPLDLFRGKAHTLNLLVPLSLPCTPHTLLYF